MTPCGFSTSACRISSTRVVPPSLCASVGTQALRHRRYHLERQVVIRFDRIAELGMAEHHGLDRTVGDHGRGCRSPVQHADLPEKLSGSKLRDRLAPAGYLHVTTLQDEEGFGWLSLGDQGLTRLETYLIDAARHELEVVLGNRRKQRHLSQPIDLRIRHVENTTLLAPSRREHGGSQSRYRAGSRTR